MNVASTIRQRPLRLILLRIAAVASVFFSVPAMAQETPTEQIEGTGTVVNELSDLDELREKIRADDQVIRFLEARLEQTDGLIRGVTQARLDIVTKERFESFIKLANLVARRQENEEVVGSHLDEVIAELPLLPAAVFASLDRTAARAAYPDDQLSTVELIEADQALFQTINDIDDNYSILVDYLAVAEKLGVNVNDDFDAVVVRISDAAANRSAFLELSTRTLANIRAGLAILPGNEDLVGRQSAADARIKLIAGSLQRISGYMSSLDLDVRRYRQQVLQATGEITTDVLDVGVVASLLAEWTQRLKDVAIEQGPKLLFQLLLVILIIFIFVRASRLVEKVINRALDSAKVTVSHLLRRMLVSSGKNLVILLGILIGLSQIGISLGPLLAGLGIAGFIVGFAMQDSLSNFASGMLILFYRPFDVGDVVEAGGVFGKVQSMSLVNTTFMTFDNQTLVVPNNMIWQSVIKNVTAQQTRRVDLTFGISYGDDILKAEKVFRDVCESHDKVLDDPEPMIHLHELADSSVNFIVRPWVKTDDYWDVYWDLMKTVKLRLDEEGISIPFPQRDVHLIEQKAG